MNTEAKENLLKGLTKSLKEEPGKDTLPGLPEEISFRKVLLLWECVGSGIERSCMEFSESLSGKCSLQESFMGKFICIGKGSI